MENAYGKLITNEKTGYLFCWQPTKIRKVKAWASVDIRDKYFMEIFNTRNEAEAFRRGTKWIEDGKFIIVPCEIRYLVKEKQKLTNKKGE